MTEDGRQKAEVCPERNRRNRRQRTEGGRQMVEGRARKPGNQKGTRFLSK